MARTRVKDAINTVATEFVTACPFCYQALLIGIQGLNAPLTMRDINELIVMSLGEELGEKPTDRRADHAGTQSGLSEENS